MRCSKIQPTYNFTEKELTVLRGLRPYPDVIEDFWLPLLKKLGGGASYPTYPVWECIFHVYDTKKEESVTPCKYLRPKFEAMYKSLIVLAKSLHQYHADSPEQHILWAAISQLEDLESLVSGDFHE